MQIPRSAPADAKAADAEVKAPADAKAPVDAKKTKEETKKTPAAVQKAPAAVARPVAGIQILQGFGQILGGVGRVVLNSAKPTAEDEIAENVFPPADRGELKKLSESRALLVEGRFGEAVRDLGDILESPDDRFFQPDKNSPIHHSLKAERSG